VVVEGESPGDNPAQAAALIEPWAGAGATWWLETRWSAESLDEVFARVRQGPPPVEAATMAG
jgi:hypothetical protein